jgi:hypothetical protein
MMHRLSSIVPTILFIIHQSSISNARSTNNLFIRKGLSTILLHNDNFAKHNENTIPLHSLVSIRAGDEGKRDTMTKKKRKKRKTTGQSKDDDKTSKSVIKEALKEDAAIAMGDAIR